MCISCSKVFQLNAPPPFFFIPVSCFFPSLTVFRVLSRFQPKLLPPAIHRNSGRNNGLFCQTVPPVQLLMNQSQVYQVYQLPPVLPVTKSNVDLFSHCIPFKPSCLFALVFKTRLADFVAMINYLCVKQKSIKLICPASCFPPIKPDLTLACLLILNKYESNCHKVLCYYSTFLIVCFHIRAVQWCSG